MAIPARYDNTACRPRGVKSLWRQVVFLINLLSATGALENTTLYAYNEDKLRVKETAPDGAVTSYEYNENGQTTAITDALGSTTR